MTIKIDHINLTVKNLKESMDWYGKMFGFKIVESGKTQKGTKWGIVAFNDAMICMAEYKERKIASKEDDESVHKIYHFGIRVSDEAKWKQLIHTNNIQLQYGGVIEYPYSKSWYIHDPSGHEIEVSFTDKEILEFPTI
jgi:catechol-2,3-dioxygenase